MTEKERKIYQEEAKKQGKLPPGRPIKQSNFRNSKYGRPAKRRNK